MQNSLDYFFTPSKNVKDQQTKIYNTYEALSSMESSSSSCTSKSSKSTAKEAPAQEYIKMDVTPELPFPLVLLDGKETVALYAMNLAE